MLQAVKIDSIEYLHLASGLEGAPRVQRYSLIELYSAYPEDMAQF